MEKELDNILENFHLGKIDLIEVKKRVIILYGVILPKGTICVCDNRRPFPHEDLKTYFCTNCGKDIKLDMDNIIYCDICKFNKRKEFVCDWCADHKGINEYIVK